MDFSPRLRLFPIIAIPVVAVLLAAFLYLQFRAPEARPLIPERDPEPLAVDQKEPERTSHVTAARDALARGDLDGAAEAVARLRALGENPELAALELEMRKAHQDREDDDRTRAKRAFHLVEPDLRSLKDDYLWGQARAQCRKLEKDHPAVAQISEYRMLRKKIEELEEDADRTFRGLIEAAETSLEKNEFSDAILKSINASRYYPERASRAAKIEEQARNKWLFEKMVFIPAAPEERPWKVGSSEKDHPDEGPRREFRRGDFFLDRTEVTNGEYEVFVRTSGHAPPRSKYWRKDRADPRFTNHPVTGVTYPDAIAYAKWAGKRLPTAEEWEAAARWLDARIYPWGNEFQSDENTYHCNSLEYSQFRNNLLPMEVGSFSNGKSPYGVDDLAGNVWEWTSTARPLGGSDRMLQVCKGGSFMTTAALIRASNIFLEDPDLAHQDIGFRCARDPE